MVAEICRNPGAWAAVPLQRRRRRAMRRLPEVAGEALLSAGGLHQGTERDEVAVEAGAIRQHLAALFAGPRQFAR